MDTPLTDPMAIAMANQFFDDLIALTDEHHALAQLLPTINDFRYETLNYPDMLRTPMPHAWLFVGLTRSRAADRRPNERYESTPGAKS